MKSKIWIVIVPFLIGLIAGNVVGCIMAALIKGGSV